MEIIIAQKDHFKYIQQIAQKTWPVTFAGILSSQQINYMLEWMYSDTALEEQIYSKGHVFYLAKNDNDYLGFASYEVNYKENSGTKLHKIYILPEAQGQGVGKILLREVVARAVAFSNDALLLNVNRNNPAVDFYKSQGFEIVGEEDIDIGNGYLMEDYVMEKKLS